MLINCANPICGAPLEKGREKCAECGQWQQAPTVRSPFETVRLSEAPDDEIDRISVDGFDPAFGGGLVRGLVYLLGGTPGGGKSTMALQLVRAIAGPGMRGDILYVAAEEKGNRIKARAKRLFPSVGVEGNIVLLNAMGKGPVFAKELGPWILSYDKPLSAIIVDSLSGLVSRDMLLAVEIAKAMQTFVSVPRNIPVIVLDHVNKEEEMAGFMALQHEVDWTGTLFPVGGGQKRRLETLKNREGPAPVTLDLMMTPQGLIAVKEKGAEDENSTDSGRGNGGAGNAEQCEKRS